MYLCRREKYLCTCVEENICIEEKVKGISAPVERKNHYENLCTCVEEKIICVPV